MLSIDFVNRRCCALDINGPPTGLASVHHFDRPVVVECIVGLNAAAACSEWGWSTRNLVPAAKVVFEIEVVIWVWVEALAVEGE